MTINYPEMPKSWGMPGSGDKSMTQKAARLEQDLRTRLNMEEKAISPATMTESRKAFLFNEYTIKFLKSYCAMFGSKTYPKADSDEVKNVVKVWLTAAGNGIGVVFEAIHNSWNDLILKQPKADPVETTINTGDPLADQVLNALDKILDEPAPRPVPSVQGPKTSDLASQLDF